MKAGSELEGALFFALLRQAGLPLPTPEFRFHPKRKWRWDYAWEAQKVGLEVDGGVWTGGRHTRGAGWLGDTEKLNTAARLGWVSLRVTPKHLATTGTVELVRDVLAIRAQP